MHILIAFGFFIVSSITLASPQLVICLSDCSQRQVIQLSDQAWTEVITLFKNQAATDQDELDKIASALLCIEKDIINQFRPDTEQQSESQPVDFTFTNKDETFNARKALILFLDKGFIQRHILRNSQKRTIWLVNKESAVALQSIKTGEIYIVDPGSTEFGSKPNISLYSEWKNEKTIKHIPEVLKKLLPESNTIPAEHDDF